MKTIKNIISNTLNFIKFLIELVVSLVLFAYHEIRKRKKNEKHQYENMATMRQQAYERNDFGYPCTCGKNKCDSDK